ncbi:hypothetical protein LZU96_21440 (plasmid) [Pantoea agglomerans]|uniref:hypothetical protein n=1 Tax=Enterobacter agglomerans TaxID=549 RepID=UPI001F29876B|nr:hypothetical protein [Pantoea agglomerans]UIL54713.1 hypothetical protein LZU96_21440 [Pantoea agglomerans]
MKNNDELERQLRDGFAEEFEVHTGWHPDDYPSPGVVETSWEIWRDGWQAALSSKQEEA